MTTEKSPDAQRLTTTLNLLRSANACELRYKHLVKCLGGIKFDHNEQINLLTILAHNGVADCLWAIRATAENSDKVSRLMAADFAEAVLPLYETRYPNDDRPRKAIIAARGFAHAEIWDAARDAARDAAWAARAAAKAAGWVAEDAAWAARDAARAAARDAAEKAQKQIILRYLLTGEN